MLIFRQLFDPTSSTYTYLLGDAGEAVLIDPVFENVRRDLALLRELGLRLTATLDTHVHADHVTAAWLLKARSGSQILLSEAAAATHVDRPLRHGEAHVAERMRREQPPTRRTVEEAHLQQIRFDDVFERIARFRQ